MMKTAVHGIILCQQKIMCHATSTPPTQGGAPHQILISGETQGQEQPHETMERILRHYLPQVALAEAIKFQFKLNPQGTVFVIELQEFPSLNEITDTAKVEWRSLTEPFNFQDRQISLLRLVFENAILNHYTAPWVEVLQQNYYQRPQDAFFLRKLYRQRAQRQVDQKASPALKGTALLLSFGLGLLFQYFFLWDHKGISVPIFNLAFLSSALWLLKSKVNFKRPLSWVFLIPYLLVSLWFALYNNPTLAALNLLAMPLLLTGALLTLRYGDPLSLDLPLLREILRQVFKKPITTFPKAFTFGKELSKGKKGFKLSGPQKSVLLGLFFSIPLLGIILSLLASADLIFEHYIDLLGSHFTSFKFLPSFPETIVTLGAALLFFGFLWSLEYREEPSLRKQGTFPALNGVTMLTVITLMNVAYLLFTLIQFSYLYGGGQRALPPGVTYAAYARRGFFELVLVAMINFTILIGSLYFTKTEKPWLHRIAQSLLVIFTLNMLFSAYYKMSLYEAAYGYTTLRLFVKFFMGLLAILSLLFLLRIWRPSFPLIQYALISTLVIYLGLNYANVDGWVVKENLRRYGETEVLDLEYLLSLSYDAVPELASLLDPREPLAPEVKRALENKQTYMLQHYDRWFEYNIHKEYLKELLP